MANNLVVTCNNMKKNTETSSIFLYFHKYFWVLVIFSNAIDWRQKRKYMCYIINYIFNFLGFLNHYIIWEIIWSIHWLYLIYMCYQELYSNHILFFSLLGANQSILINSKNAGPFTEIKNNMRVLQSFPLLQIMLPHKANVDPKTAMKSRAIETDKNPISNRSPTWILGSAVETHLQGTLF